MSTETLKSNKACIVSVTRAGNDTAERIVSRVKSEIDCYTLEKYARPGFFTFKNLGKFFEDAFENYDTVIAVMATGIVVRLIAPLIRSKKEDPGVIVTDVLGENFIPLLSGHLGGAVENAARLAAATGGNAIITTASDKLGRPAVDTIAAEIGAKISSMEEAKAVTALIVEDKKIALIGFSEEDIKRLGLGPIYTALPYPPDLFDPEMAYSNLNEIIPLIKEEYDGVIILSDRERLVSFDLPTAHLIPVTTVIGIGLKKGVPETAILEGIEKILGDINISPQSIKTLATIPLKKDEPGLLRAAEQLGAEINIIPDEEVKAVEHLFSPSPFVKSQVGLGSVSEPCGYIASNHGECLVEAVRENGMVLSVWREESEDVRPEKITVVGLGPGPEMMSPGAREALMDSDVIVGYKTYIDLIRFDPDFRDKEFLATGMRSERERAEMVLKLADSGRRVSLVSSGDPGVYGMAGILLESAEGGDYDIEVIPGITAANAAAAKLGAPLMNDYCVISLSDILTPWETIKKRLRAALEGDFVIVLYNPRSKSRTEQFEEAVEMIGEVREPGTPVGIVTNAGREGEKTVLTTLEMLPENDVNMFSTVIVGNSTTRFSEDGSRMITPRGYG